ncbi:MAG: hypothetical protein ACJ743_08295 [Gaiellaceae bacterium]
MAAAVARKWWALIGVAIVAALAFSTTATAGLIGTGSASYCDPYATKAFAAWGDSAYYASLFNGGFENGSAGWTLAGGAKVVSGNEPFYISGDRRDTHSLLLPTGSSAYSGTVCFALGDWHLRLLARNVGSRTGALRVQVVVPSLLGGLLTVLDGGTVSGTGTWAPSPRLQLALCNVTSLLGTRAVAFRFTPVGTGAAYQLDDVYLDPWKGT